MKYYVRLTILLGLVYGLIGVQRIVIAVIMPSIQEDMKFTYTDVGLIMAVTGLLWAFGAVTWAAVGDRWGRRPVIAGTTLLAAVFSWLTGLVTSVGQMLAVRGVLGFFEGGPFSPSVATVSEEAPPKNRGFVVAFIPACFALLGGVAGPIAAVAFLEEFGSWRHVFYFISIPGALFAVITLFVMHEPPSIAERVKMRKSGKGKALSSGTGGKDSLISVLRYKNVIVSTVMSVAVMGWLWVSQAFLALFLTKIHSMGMGQIGAIMGIMGLGGFIGMPVSGLVSDHLGRKTVMIGAGITSTLCGIMVCMLPNGVSLPVLSLSLALWGFCTAATYPLYLGALLTECVPEELAGTAVSVPTGVGEIFGAAVVPTIAGILADRFGLYAPMWMATLSGVAIACISFFYIETAPKKVSRMRSKPNPDDYLIRRFRAVGL
ncbi:MAG: MFS transporter [Thermodesulfobacteriota bacterium]